VARSRHPQVVAYGLLQGFFTFDTKDTEDTKDKLIMLANEASHAVIDCALDVHTAIGAGMLESAVCACLFHEFANKGLHFEHQVHLPLIYKQVRLPVAYRVDFIVEHCLIVEIKCVEKLLPVHAARVLSYLKLSGHKLGLLLNFNVPHLRQGIRRIINGPESEL
jgi:GxxExxY protein